MLYFRFLNGRLIINIELYYIIVNQKMVENKDFRFIFRFIELEILNVFSKFVFFLSILSYFGGQLFWGIREENCLIVFKWRKRE